MKQNLERFGKLLVENCYNEGLEIIHNNRTSQVDNEDPNEFTDRMLKEMTPAQYADFVTFQKHIFDLHLFSLMRIFEENSEFKLVYMPGEKDLPIDFLHLTEGLMHESNSSCGWIHKFGKEGV